MAINMSKFFKRTVFFEKGQYAKIKSMAVEAGVPMYEYMAMVLGKWIEFATDSDVNSK